jgi:hypothetical protein
MEDCCPHLIPDEDGNCLECGAPLPELECPDLGDILSIVRLIDETGRTCGELIRANRDPINSNLPRLRMVGGQFVRLPHAMIYRELLSPSYNLAKSYGYRGSFERWADLVNESIPAQN